MLVPVGAVHVAVGIIVLYALMRLLEGSTEKAVCSTSRWHTCTTSDAKPQYSRLCMGGGKPTPNACVAPCQIETTSTLCSPSFDAAIIRLRYNGNAIDFQLRCLGNTQDTFC